MGHEFGGNCDFFLYRAEIGRKNYRAMIFKEKKSDLTRSLRIEA
ncbi:MAG: hypothetical protein ACJAVM_002507 [Sulfitobacter sp.]|jgi:hypothetical protein